MDNLNGFLAEKERLDKLLLSIETVLACISTISFLVLVFFAEYFEMPVAARVVMILSGIVILAVGVCYSIKIEQLAGYYECDNCGHRYVPSYWSVFWAMHTGRTRYMKCPRCGKRTWNKKVITKASDR